MTDITKLARDVIDKHKRLLSLWAKPAQCPVEEVQFIELSNKLAQAVIGSTVKGERMPQTPEQFADMGDKYEKALLREKEVTGQLRAKLNKLEQKYSKAKQEQQEKDVKIAESYIDECLATDYENHCFKNIAKAIREG